MSQGLPSFSAMSIDSVTTAWAHEGSAAELVRGIKYGRRTGGVTVIAARLAPLVPEVDVVTWAPAGRVTQRRRGFDQAELLARAVAARRGLPCRRLMTRGRGPAQTQRDGAGRRLGPVLNARRVPPGVRVLVVDDVVTTGATLDAAAEVLRAAGAVEVHGAAATRAQRGATGAARVRRVPSAGTPDYGGTSWTSPSAHGT